MSETVWVPRSAVWPDARSGVGPLLRGLSQDCDRRARLAVVYVQAAFSNTPVDPFPVRCPSAIADIIRRNL